MQTWYNPPAHVEVSAIRKRSAITAFVMELIDSFTFFLHMVYLFLMNIEDSKGDYYERAESYIVDRPV